MTRLNYLPVAARLLLSLVVVCISQYSVAVTQDFEALPGADEIPSSVRGEIQEVWSQMGPDHDIRSKHRQPDGSPVFANRLLLETSPYLVQHAHNPVNWFPWGDEAFAEARRRDVPVLLSVGYSSCHWCHVIEEESYDDLDMAQLINRNFVAVKVDREANPEVDEIHLLALQIMGGSGGWPLHVFLTPDRNPFLGMTYLPPDEFELILNRVQEVWEQDRATINNVAQEVARALQGYFIGSVAPVDIGRKQIEQVIEIFLEEEALRDEFSAQSARFPSESEILLFLNTALRYQHSDALRLAETRLTEMALGGIRDHVGGGFHRYTVDSEWMIPHFEKMLYNQAQLARIYLYAYDLTGEPLYERVARQILRYVLRDMTNSDGVFYSAMDADSEGEEGTFYLWTLEEITQAAGEYADFLIAHYGATQDGNFEGVNILHVPTRPEQRASLAGQTVDDYLGTLAVAVERLRTYRENRVKPFLDRKIITAWNALMITALTDAARITGDKSYLGAAERAARHIWDRHLSGDGLSRIEFEGKLSGLGKLRDYAYFLQALLDLYDETGDDLWLERGEKIASMLLNRFWDIRQGGFYSTSVQDTAGLIVRPKDMFDRALPSGNSVAAQSLARLYRRTGNQTYSSRAQQVFQAIGLDLTRNPTSWTYALNGLEEHNNGSVGTSDYAASGQARVSVSIPSASGSKAAAVIEIDLADGWHIQSDRPLSENLIRTEVNVVGDDWRLGDVVYPPAESFSATFQSEPISVFSGKVQIFAELIRNQDAGFEFGPVISVRLQACDDKLCLLPETLELEIPMGAFKG